MGNVFPKPERLESTRDIKLDDLMVDTARFFLGAGSPPSSASRRRPQSIFDNYCKQELVQVKITETAGGRNLDHC
jgi:hypothetical protein